MASRPLPHESIRRRALDTYELISIWAVFAPKQSPRVVVFYAVWKWKRRTVFPYILGNSTGATTNPLCSHHRDTSHEDSPAITVGIDVIRVQRVRCIRFKRRFGLGCAKWFLTSWSIQRLGKEQTVPDGQVPQVPPHRSGPQTFE